MPRLDDVSPHARAHPDFAKRQAHHRALWQRHTERLHASRHNRGQKALLRHAERNKLSVHARIDALLDAGAPFLELSALAAWGQYDDMAPQAGIVCGIGKIHGRLCMIVANDPTVKGGAYFAETIKKHLRAQSIAEENRLPCIYLADSGGIYLPHQADVFADREHFGRIFYNQARMSSMGIAQICVVLGMCTAGGAYVPAMSDESIIVKDNGTVFLAGPALVRAATGERVDAQRLGGASMHTEVSGVIDVQADDEQHALILCREKVAWLYAHHTGDEPTLQPKTSASQADAQSFVEPVYDIADLAGILPTTNKEPFDVHDVISRIVDGSDFTPFRPMYGTTLVCGMAKLYGRAVGIIANNGILLTQSAQKGAHFINVCTKRRIPLLFLQNITGFMVGQDAERGGIAKAGAQMVQAVACAPVPKLTLIIGGSHGAGNYAMCGRAFAPRFLFTWPHSQISVMGAEQAASVLKTVTQNGDDEAQHAVLATYKHTSDAYYATSRVWDDGIILPSETRRVLGLAVEACLHTPHAHAAAPVIRP